MNWLDMDRRLIPLQGILAAGLAIGLGLAGSLASLPGRAAETADTNGQTIGRVSGLPVPRFVSLKADRVNLREGPSKDHRTTWIYERAGLPVEITAEFGMWRKVRDSGRHRGLGAA